MVTLGLDWRGCLTVNAPVTLNNTIITNDLVEIIAPDKFRFLGRYDHVINSGGIKIFPEKVEVVVEKVLNDLNINSRFFIAGTENERYGEQVTLFVEGKPFVENEKRMILESLRNNLSSYEAPKEILFKEKFAETATGKIDRRASIHL